MKIITYNRYLNEDFFNDFKTNYFKLFKDIDQDINRDFGNYLKKLETENDFNIISKTFNQFLSANQTTFSTKIDNSETIDQINKLILDNLKVIYFSTLPTVTKFNNQNFTMDLIFQKSADKNFKNLMNMPEKSFSDACTQYVNTIMIPEINKKVGIQTQTNQTNNPTAQNVNNQTTPTTEKYNNMLKKILEADQPDKKTLDDLKNYKTVTKNWFNAFYKSLFDSSKLLVNQETKNTTVNKGVDQIVKTMTNSKNELAKKQLINKITTMSKEELQKLGDSLGLKKEEIGEF